MFPSVFLVWIVNCQSFPNLSGQITWDYASWTWIVSGILGEGFPYFSPPFGATSAVWSLWIWPIYEYVNNQNYNTFFTHTNRTQCLNWSENTSPNHKTCHTKHVLWFQSSSPPNWCYKSSLRSKMFSLTLLEINPGFHGYFAATAPERMQQTNKSSNPEFLWSKWRKDERNQSLENF